MKSTKHILEWEEFDDLQSLKKDMEGLGLTLTDEEEIMMGFLKEFGSSELSPEEFAEYIYDYATSPEEYGIDTESEYFESIEMYLDDIMGCSRGDFSSPMYKHGATARWNLNCIRESEVYKTYLKVLSLIGKS